MSMPGTALREPAPSRRLNNPVALDRPNYPENQWWVAATSDELGSLPMQRWILGLPVLLYRRADGRAVALDDRCPHRWAPLSLGRVEGDDIVCGYHGLRFGPDGFCTRVPTQDTVPSTAKVRSYPVMERAPFVWVWTGDPAQADGAEPPPDLAWAADESRVTARGAMELGCNYMALKENVLDLSHFAYAHANTLAVTDWTSPPDVETTKDTVSYRQRFQDVPLPAHYGIPTGIGCERPVDREAWGTYVSPALQLAGVDIVDDLSAPASRRDFSLRICHAATPIDEGSCHYWWYFSQDYGHADGAVERLTERIAAAFTEDRVILEATERLVRRDSRGRDCREVSVLCDRAAIQARIRLQRSIETDQPQAATSNIAGA